MGLYLFTNYLIYEYLLVPHSNVAKTFPAILIVSAFKTKSAKSQVLHSFLFL